MNENLTLLDDVIQIALKSGADQADAVYSEQRRISVQCRNGSLEKTGRADRASLSLRVFVGQKTASLSVSDFDASSLKNLIDKAIIIAREAPDDPSARLVEPDQLATNTDLDLDLLDNRKVGSEDLLSSTLEMEETLLATDGVEQSMGITATAGDTTFALRTSKGFSGIARRTGFSRSCGAVAANADGKTTDFYGCGKTFFEDLEPAAIIGAEAGRRAVRKLGGQRIQTGSFPVVFAPRRSSFVLNNFASAVAGPAVVRGMSFLKESMGARIFPESINIIDDPHMKRGPASRAFDGEGVATNRIEFVEDGHLKCWATDAASAGQLGWGMTGHANSLGRGVDFSNLYMAAGDATVEDLLADIKYGLYVTDFLGRGADPVTGRYSQGASGFLIENGQITMPIKEATVAGSLQDMFLNLTPANDLELREQFNAPTIRVDGMTVAGK